MPMGRPLADYATTFNKLVREMGVGNRVQASVPELATLIGEPTGRVQRVMDVLKRTDSVKFELGHQGKGRIAYYTLLTGDIVSVESRMKERGIPWSSKQETFVPAEPKRQNGVVKSFADLGTLRKSEPRAELEVARKYRDQQSFIAEQREKFREMGLEMPEPAPMYDEMRRVELTAIVRILPYVESIEKANENLTDQNRTIRQPQAELQEARGLIARQKEQIERLIAEKTSIKDDVQRLITDHKEEAKDLRRQVENLESQLRQARGNRAINGAIAVTEVKEEITRVAG